MGARYVMCHVMCHVMLCDLAARQLEERSLQLHTHTTSPISQLHAHTTPLISLLLPHTTPPSRLFPSPSTPSHRRLASRLLALQFAAQGSTRQSPLRHCTREHK